MEELVLYTVWQALGEAVHSLHNQVSNGERPPHHLELTTVALWHHEGSGALVVPSRKERGGDYIRKSRNFCAHKSRNKIIVPAGAVTETMMLRRDADAIMGPAEQ